MHDWQASPWTPAMRRRNGAKERRTTNRGLRIPRRSADDLIRSEESPTVCRSRDCVWVERVPPMRWFYMAFTDVPVFIPETDGSETTAAAEGAVGW